jgi:hypothetical protein
MYLDSHLAAFKSDGILRLPYVAMNGNLEFRRYRASATSVTYVFVAAPSFIYYP